MRYTQDIKTYKQTRDEKEDKNDVKNDQHSGKDSVELPQEDFEILVSRHSFGM